MASLRMRGSVGVVLAAALFTGVARADDLDYLPSGAVVVMSINVADVMKSPLPRELTRLQPEMAKSIPAVVQERYGIDLSNVARITRGAAGPGQDVVVIATIKPVTAAAIKAAMKPGPYEENLKFEEVKVAGHAVYEQSYGLAYDKKAGPFKGAAFGVVNDRLVVYGYLAPLKAVLERGPKPDASPRITAALKKKGLSSTLTLVFDIARVPAKERPYLKKDLAKLAPGIEDVFESFGAFTLRADAGTKVHAVAALHCKDVASAKTTAKLAETALATLKAKTKGDNVPPDVARAMQNARKLLDAIKVSVHEDRVVAEATVEYAPAIQAFLDLTTVRVEKGTKKIKPPVEEK